MFGAVKASHSLQKQIKILPLNLHPKETLMITKEREMLSIVMTSFTVMTTSKLLSHSIRRVKNVK